MQTKERKVEERESLIKRMFRLTRPIFVETFLLMLVGVIDILMLSRISDVSVAAVGLVNQLLNMVFLIFIVGATGTMVVCSQYLGARRIGDYALTLTVSLLLNTVLGLIVSVLLALFAHEILQLMDVTSPLEDDALIYLQIVGGSAFLYGLSVTCGSILRARERAVYPMYVSLISNLINLVGNYALIFGHFGCPALGVEGAAWATAFSRLVGLILLGLFLYVHALPEGQRNKASDWSTKLGQVLRIGLPGAGEMFSYAASQVVITYFINSLGTASLAARTYLMHIVILTFVFAISIAQGASVVAGHLVGRRSYLAAQRVGAYATRAAVTISLLLALILALLSPIFVPWLTNNPEIQDLCLTLLWIDVVLEVGRAVNILTGRLLSAVGDPLFPLKTSLIVVWSVATLGSYVFGILLGYGLIAMWCLFLLDECLRALIQWRHWLSGSWMHKGFC